MNTHILIIGAGLTGLTTAFRLASHGVKVSIVDQGQLLSTASLELMGQSKHATQPLAQPNESTQNLNVFPIVIHGYQHATWSLLQELETTSLLTSVAPARVEFVTDTQKPVPFNPIIAPAPFHTLIGLLLFKGIPFKDRWSLLKRLEQLWEGGDIEPPQNLDSQSVNTWLTTLEQSEQARRNVWHPLCQFFLGTDSSHSSAHYFKQTLTQCLMSARKNYRILIPPLNEESLFLTPLRNFLASQNTIWYPHSTVTQFQCDSKGISGVRLNDGSTLTAHYYISTLPRRSLVACLADRLLAKFAYFSNLTKLGEAPTLVVHLEIPHTRTKPRLFLSTNTFDWIALRSTSDGSSHTALVSCVATSKPHIMETPDHQILPELSSHLPFPLDKQAQSALSTRIIRTPHAFLSCRPDTSVFRPLPQSPLSNFFVAGPWTDTGLPSSRESSIVSANLCVQAVINSLST